MNVVADRVNRLCGFLGSCDARAEQNSTVAAAVSGILGRTVTTAEIAAVRAGERGAPPELLHAIAIHFDVDSRYILEPESDEMRVLDQKLAILETARTLGIKLGAVHFRGGDFDVSSLEMLIATIADARAAAVPTSDARHGRG